MAWLLGLAALLGLMPGPVPPELTAQVQRLVVDLGSTDPAQREAAETALLSLGPDASAPLLAAVHEAPPARLQAIQALLPRFGPAAVPRLFRAAERDFGHLHEVRNEAMVAVGRMGAPALPALRLILARGAGATFVTQALGQMGAPGRVELRALADHAEPRVRAGALAVLASAPGRDVVDVFVAALRSQDAALRLHGVRGLGGLSLPETADTVAGRLDDDVSGVRAEAAAAVSRMLTPRLRLRLAAAARDDPAATVRQAAARGLMRGPGDPLAARLGRRYLPTTTADPEEGPPRWALLLRLTFASLLVYLVAWLGARRQPETPWAGEVLGAAAVMLAIGVYWGRFAVGLDGSFERLLLWVCVPAVAWVCWFAGPRLRVLTLLAAGIGAVVLALALAPLAGFVLSVWAQARAPLWMGVSLACALVWAVWAGRGLDSTVVRRFRTAALVVLAMFYVGYALGWAALWAGSTA